MCISLPPAMRRAIASASVRSSGPADSVPTMHSPATNPPCEFTHATNTTGSGHSQRKRTRATIGPAGERAVETDQRHRAQGEAQELRPHREERLQIRRDDQHQQRPDGRSPARPVARQPRHRRHDRHAQQALGDQHAVDADVLVARVRTAARRRFRGSPTDSRRPCRCASRCAASRPRPASPGRSGRGPTGRGRPDSARTEARTPGPVVPGRRSSTSGSACGPFPPAARRASVRSKARRRRADIGR